MPLDIHPMLDLKTTSERAVVVEARVHAGTPQPLDWRLTVETAGQGGVSRVAQAGRTDGANQRPVAVVTINNPGSAVLQIVEGGRIVAQTQISIPAPK